MNVRILDLHFETDSFILRLSDGQTLTVPLVQFPVLLRATVEERRRFRISASGLGIHWPDLDEDISLIGLLVGRGDQTSRNRS